MKTAGIRAARQNLSALLDEVKKGRDVEITDRGRPVARLVPPAVVMCRPFEGRAAFRRTMPALAQPLSRTIADDREDRF